MRFGGVSRRVRFLATLCWVVFSILLIYYLGGGWFGVLWISLFGVSLLVIAYYGYDYLRRKPLLIYIPLTVLLVVTFLGIDWPPDTTGRGYLMSSLMSIIIVSLIMFFKMNRGNTFSHRS